MKKAIFLSLFLLFSVIVTQVVIADNITDKPEKVKVCDSDADFDLVNIEPVAVMAVEASAFVAIRAVY